MKKILVSILFILVALFVVDRIGGGVMWWVNQHTQDDTGPKIKYLVTDVHEDVLLMGASRSNCHYVPSIISDALGLSVYNGGIDATNNIYAHYLVLNHVLSVHKPKLICLEVMTSDFEKQEEPFNTIAFFAPYFGLNESADSLYCLAGSYWKYKLSHLYRYNSKAASNISGLVINQQGEGDNGYLPCAKPKHVLGAPGKKRTPTEVDSMKLEYVQKFIDLCHRNGVKVVFTVSPMYVAVESDCYNILKSIAHKNNVPVLDYHTKGVFLDKPEYFHDYNHLWDQGAREYSSMFARDLKQSL